MRRDGSGRRTILRAGTGEAFGPVTWSPDGTRIAFVRWRRNGARELQVANADGSGRRTLARGRFADAPAWSPDGRRIVVVVSRGEGNDIVLVDSEDGSKRRTIFTAPLIYDLDWQAVP